MEPHFRKWPFRKNYLKNKKCLVLWMARNYLPEVAFFHNGNENLTTININLKLAYRLIKYLQLILNTGQI